MNEQALLEAMRAVMKEELKPINQRLDGMQGEITGINHRLDEMQEDVTEIRRNTNAVSAWVEEIDDRTRGADIRSSSGNGDIPDRVSTLETVAQIHTAQIKDLQAKIG